MSRRKQRQREFENSTSSSSSRTGSPTPSAEMSRDRQKVSEQTSDVMTSISKIIPLTTTQQPASTPAESTVANKASTAKLAREEEQDPLEGDLLPGDVQKQIAAVEAAALIELPPSPRLKPKKSKTPKLSILENMPPAQPIPLLICSIGNPGSAYVHTLHSAGHTVIGALASYLNASSFVKDRAYANGAVSHASFSSAQPLWTLYQSPSYMNESGKPISKAYQSWYRGLGPDSHGARLVILHDELEKPLGAVSVREGQGLSARGHNGIKSLLGQMGKTPFVRVGVGIGRPVSREPNDVAKYVLKKMTPSERERVEGAAGEIMARLRVLSGG